MKKESSIATERIRFYKIKSMMEADTKWENLSPGQQEGFVEFFINDNEFQNLCKVIISTNVLYEDGERAFFEQLSQGTLSLPNEIADAYSFVSERHLWNPFQVLYGRDLSVFPYHGIERQLPYFRYNHFFNLNYKGQDISENLTGCIRIARLLKTFIQIPETSKQYSIRIKTSILHAPKTYSLAFNTETNLFTITNGIGIGIEDQRICSNLTALLTFLCKDIIEFCSIVRKELPPLKAREILERIRFEECHQRISLSLWPKSIGYDRWYPFSFSQTMIQDFSWFGKEVPFEARSKR